MNPQTGTLHYVKVGETHHPCLLGVLPARTATMQAVDFVDTVLSPTRSETPIANGRRVRVHKSCAVWSVEQSVEDLLRADPGNTTRACQLLVHGIQLEPSNLRLYDRLAVLTARDGASTYRQELIRLAKQQIQVERSEDVSARGGPGSAYSGRFQSSDGSRPPSYLEDLWERALGRRATVIEPTRMRQRHRCIDGQRKPRTGNRVRISLASALERRINAWNNADSRWNKKWADSSRQWQVPGPPRKCSST